MGMYDTFYFGKPIPCAFCNTPIDSVQSKEFMNVLQSYHVGNRVDGSTVTGIIKTDLYCPNYATHPDKSKEQYVYIVVWHHVYIGIATTESEAESMLNKFGMGEKGGENKIPQNNSKEGNDAEDEDDDEFNPNWHHYCGYCEVEDGPTTKHFDWRNYIFCGCCYCLRHLFKDDDACGYCGNPLIFNE